MSIKAFLHCGGVVRPEYSCSVWQIAMMGFPARQMVIIADPVGPEKRCHSILLMGGINLKL